MADEAVEHIRIGAAPGRCFEVAVDFERYPRWATDVREAEVLDRDGDGRGTKVRFAVAAMGQNIRYILDYDYAKAPTEFSWKLAESNILTALDGSYRFDPDAGGDGTALTYRLAVDLNLPLPGFMRRQAAQMVIQNALKGFKRYLEAGGDDAGDAGDA
jgi:Polyketide cyclase / dehydrase and lipid transport.